MIHQTCIESMSIYKSDFGYCQMMKFNGNVFAPLLQQLVCIESIVCTTLIYRNSGCWLWSIGYMIRELFVEEMRCVSVWGLE